MKADNLLLHIILFLFIAGYSFAQNVGSSSRMNINHLNIPFDNKGIIAAVNVPDPNPSVSGAGGKFAGHIFLYSAGFWISGYSNTELWANGVASHSLVNDYQPGVVGMQPTDPRASIFRVRLSDTPFGQSWQDWKDAVDLGAAFYDGDGDGIYTPIDKNGNGVWDPDEDKPEIFGDQNFFCVFNDGIPANLRRWGSEPQGIEIRQNIFASSSTGALGNAFFIKYKIKNTGLITDTLKDVYFGINADPDIGDPSDDVGACDTLRGSTYTYNDGPDLEYGSTPPSFFTDLLGGPHSYIPGETFIDNNQNNQYDEGIDTPIDTALYMAGPLGIRIYPGAKNLTMSSSIYSFNSSDTVVSDPLTFVHARNYMLGYNRNGNIVNPCSFNPYGEVRGGVPCDQVNPLFWFSGNPVTDLGWINTHPWDIRQLLNVGPFKLVTNEEVEILVAFLVASGSDHLNAITVTRGISDFVQDYYDNNFGFPMVVSADTDEMILTNFQLSQNYPNPFNPSTKISWQSPVGSWQVLKVFDVLGIEVRTLVNEFKPAGIYEVEFDASGLSSGVYYYQLRAGEYIETKKMIYLK